MKKIILYSMVMILIQGLLGCSKDKKFSLCVDRGVSYFKEIGSYPKLSSKPNIGRSAESVAIERCNRTTTAF